MRMSQRGAPSSNLGEADIVQAEVIWWGRDEFGVAHIRLDKCLAHGGPTVNWCTEMPAHCSPGKTRERTYRRKMTRTASWSVTSPVSSL